MIWIKPKWAPQISDGDYEFWLGDCNGYIRCDSKLEYSLSEATYQPRYNLNNQRQINLKVFTLNDELIASNADQDVVDDGKKAQERRRIEFESCVDNANEQFILEVSKKTAKLIII